MEVGWRAPLKGRLMLPNTMPSHGKTWLHSKFIHTWVVEIPCIFSYLRLESSLLSYSVDHKQHSLIPFSISLYPKTIKFEYIYHFISVAIKAIFFINDNRTFYVLHFEIEKSDLGNKTRK